MSTCTWTRAAGPFPLPVGLSPVDAENLGLPDAGVRYSEYAVTEEVQECVVHGHRRVRHGVFHWGKRIVFRR